jgi:potassium voltage-gated channel Shal-related subfamily D member 2
MVLIALPSFVVGREFSIVWAELSADNDDPSPEGGARGMSAVAADPFGTRPSVARSTDLSNRKLAQNQTELARQIVELRAAVDQQNALMRQILERLPSGEGARGKSPVL